MATTTKIGTWGGLGLRFWYKGSSNLREKGRVRARELLGQLVMARVRVSIL